MELKVMLVDDDDMANFLQRVILINSKLCDKVDCFLNGREALNHLVNNDGNGDAYFMFLDINMPVMNGWELLTALDQQAFSSKIYIVLLSSYIEEADIKKLKRYSRVVGHFEKPVTTGICHSIMNLPQLSPWFANCKIKTDHDLPRLI